MKVKQFVSVLLVFILIFGFQSDLFASEAKNTSEGFLVERKKTVLNNVDEFNKILNGMVKKAPTFQWSFSSDKNQEGIKLNYKQEMSVLRLQEKDEVLWLAYPGMIDYKAQAPNLTELNTQLLDEVLDLNIKVVQCEDFGLEPTYDNYMELLESGQVDFATYLNYATPDRRELDQPLETSENFAYQSLHVFTRKDTNINNPVNFATDRIGITTNLGKFSTIIDTNYYNVTIKDTPGELGDLLEAGEIDYAIVEPLEYKNLRLSNTSLKARPITTKELPRASITAATANPDNEGAIEVMNKIYNEDIIRQFLDYTEYSIARNRYLINVVDLEVVSKETMDYLDERPLVRVGVYDTKFLMEKTEDGYKGHIYDTLGQLSTILNIDFELYDYTGRPYTDMLDDIRDGNLEMIFAGTDISDKKVLDYEYGKYEPYYTLSDTYLKSAPTYLKKDDVAPIRDVRDTPFYKMGYVKSDEPFIFDRVQYLTNYGQYEANVYDTTDDLIAALEEGEVNLAVCMPVLKNYLEDLGVDDINYAIDYNGMGVDNIPFSFVISNQYEHAECLNTAIDKGLNTLFRNNVNSYWLNGINIYKRVIKVSNENRLIFLLSMYLLVALLASSILYLSRIVKINKRINTHLYIEPRSKLLTREALQRDFSPSEDYYCVIFEFADIEGGTDRLTQDQMAQLDIRIGKRIKESIAGQSVRAYRFAGDEFLLIFKVDDILNFDIEKKLNDVLSIIKNPYKVDNFYLDFDISCGVCSTMFTHNKTTLLLYSYEMLLKNKNISYSKYSIFSIEDKKLLDQRKDINEHLTEQLSQSVFAKYQPIVNRYKELVGFEVIPHLKIGDEVYTRQEFLREAGKNNTIDKVEHKILFDVIDFRMNLLNKGLITKDIFFTVNASIETLKNINNVYIEELLNEHDLTSLKFLKFEIYEADLSDSDIDSYLDRLEHYEISKVLDNFSLGHSSLTIIEKYEFDFVKLSEAFVKDAGESGGVAPLLIKMLKELRIEVLALGIDTKKEADMMLPLGCNYMQGDFYHKALYPSEVMVYCDK